MSVSIASFHSTEAKNASSPKHLLEKKPLTFFTTGSYTLWTPYLEGMNIAYAVGSHDLIGDTIRPITKAQSGFIVGTGITTYHDDWILSANYTFFNNSPSSHPQKLVNDAPYNTPFSTLTFTSDYITSQFTNQFNKITFILEKEFRSGKYLVFKPWIGFLTAFEKQHLNFQLKESGEGDSRRYRLIQHWWEVGPYTGIDCTYYIIKQFGVFMSTGGALCRSYHYLNAYFDEADETGIIGATPFRNSDSTYTNIEPMVETSIGMRGDMKWRYVALRLEIAWDMQTYFSHNGFAGYYSPLGVYGNYSMGGLTLGARLSY